MSAVFDDVTSNDNGDVSSDDGVFSLACYFLLLVVYCFGHFD